MRAEFEMSSHTESFTCRTLAPIDPHPVKVRGFGLRRKPARCNYGIHFSKSFGAISFPTLCASNRAAPSVTCPRT